MPQEHLLQGSGLCTLKMAGGVGRVQQAGKQVFDESKGRYGTVKIHCVLNQKGIPCSIKHVQRHMAGQDLRSVVVKKYNHPANHGAVPDNKENILKRDFETDTVNQKWLTQTVDKATLGHMP